MGSPGSRRLAGLSPHGLACAALAVLLGACDGGAGPAKSPFASPSASESAVPSPSVAASPDVRAAFCGRMVELRQEFAELRLVELRPANRGLLYEEYVEVEVAHLDLIDVDLAAEDDALERPQRELEYRLLDLELAVDDYRTSPRPADAERHVGDEALAYAAAIDELDAVAGCPT